MNVPKLRFKEFKDEWKENKLHDIAKITMGQSPNSENYTYDSSDTLLIQGNADLYNGKVIPRLFTKKITKTCDKKDIIMTVRAPVGDIAISDYYACIGRGVCSIKSSKFIYHYLDYLKEKGYWKKISKGSTIDSITSDNIKSLVIKTPSRKEQEKIIRTIDLINKKIELQTREIEALKLFKKGLLNSFFQNKQPNVTIENCISYGKAGGTPSSKNKDYYDGNIPFLSISDMTSQKKYILKTEKSISQQGIKNSSAWIVPKKSIILSMYASYGLIAINKIELATSQAMFSMIVNSKNNIEYIYYYLEFLYNNNYYDRLVSIGTQANLNADKVKKIKIYLSDINSQNKISKILKLCDERMEYENKKEFELRKFKQGLLQNMFI